MKINYVLLVITFLFLSCAPKEMIVQQSELDKAVYHVDIGMKALEEGEHSTAREHFDRAIILNSKYAKAYAGLALLDSKENKAESSFDLINKALKIDDNDEELYVIQARIRMNNKWLDWEEKSMLSLEKAESINNKYPAIFYYKGELFKEQELWQEAMQEYKKVIDRGGEHLQKADEAYKEIEHVLRLHSGTIDEHDLMYMQKITRAEYAVMMIEELKIDKIYDMISSYKDNEHDYVINDLEGHWAKDWMLKIIDLDLLEISEDNRSYPDSVLKRKELAQSLQSFFIEYENDPSLGKKYFGESSRFSDMDARDFYYNALAFAVNRGLMKAGTFNNRVDPDGIVSGSEIMKIIRTIKIKFSN